MVVWELFGTSVTLCKREMIPAMHPPELGLRGFTQLQNLNTYCE